MRDMFYVYALHSIADNGFYIGFTADLTPTRPERHHADGIANTAVGDRALLSNIKGADNTAVGEGALLANKTGERNTASGEGALASNTAGSDNTAIGFAADVGSGNLTNATAIGAAAFVDASNKVRIGNTNVTVIEGQVAYTFPSDRNKKENFQPVDGEEVLRKIRQFNLTSWNYIGQDAKTLRHYGPMAQDFYEAFGHDAIGKVGTPTTINSGDMAGIMIIAIKAFGDRECPIKIYCCKARSSQCRTREETRSSYCAFRRAGQKNSESQRTA
jgi:Chaperone of endosialidase